MSLGTETRTRFAYVLQYPTDLAVASVLAVLGYLLATTFPTGSHLRLAAAIVLVAVLPGYALVSTLFPARERRARVDARIDIERRPGGIDAVERFGLAVPLSLMVTSIVVVALPLLGWDLTTESVVAALAVVTLVLAQIGALRRFRVPEPDRYTVSPLGALRRVHRSGEGTAATASSVLLALAVVAAVGMILVAFVVPQSAGGYSQLELYGEDGDGDLAAGALPNEIAPGEPIPLTFVVRNYEGDRTEYTVVVQEQVVRDGVVVGRTELQSVDVLVTHGDGGRVTSDRAVTPTASAGETVRISVLLYEGDPPSVATNENADEDVYFWTTIADDAADADADVGSDGSASDESSAGDEGETDEPDGDGEEGGVEDVEGEGGAGEEGEGSETGDEGEGSEGEGGGGEGESDESVDTGGGDEGGEGESGEGGEGEDSEGGSGEGEGDEEGGEGDDDEDDGDGPFDDGPFGDGEFSGGG